MALSEQEKENLYAEWEIRVAEMSKKDQRLRACKNRKAMLGVERYYNGPDFHCDLNVWGFYHVYLKVRNLIPNVVLLKKYHHRENAPAGVRCPDRVPKDAELSEEDYAEAEKLGKLLLDTIMNYIKEE